MIDTKRSVQDVPFNRKRRLLFLVFGVVGLWKLGMEREERRNRHTQGHVMGETERERFMGEEKDNDIIRLCLSAYFIFSQRESSTLCLCDVCMWVCKSESRLTQLPFCLLIGSDLKKRVF